MSQSEKSYRSSLGRARGLGASHGGTHHWWMQRLTAIGLIPIGLWLFYALLNISLYNYAQTVAWLSKPLNATLMCAAVFIGIYHGMLGLQVIIEDYIQSHRTRTILMVSLRFISLLLVIAAIVAIFSCIGAKI